MLMIAGLVWSIRQPWSLELSDVRLLRRTFRDFRSTPIRMVGAGELY